MKYLIPVFLLLLITGCKRNTSSTVSEAAPAPEWISLFNGKDLEGWVPKIKGELPGQDSLKTFRVNQGTIAVSYENYPEFGNRFGHLFYETPFSAYFLLVDYRFQGEQAKGGEPWAFKNSGIMFHSQSASSMLKDQNFPVSLEGQFLGGNGEDPRPTMNLCTPGTHVQMADTLFTPHCVNSTSRTFHGEEWVQAGFLVLKDSLIVHYVNGQEVLRYTKPQLGGDMAADASAEFQVQGSPLTSGYIALQSESHPLEFREIIITDLEPYFGDQEKLNEVIEGIREKTDQ
ncbi:3-keto-disaccharide hydrolase [Robertkochia flava]|uniref:3-keto-disaccharide hydrolase n=1 Tax=Robertkochia flava TaxID=3447986 RepID=UPI001CCF0C94|nr:DUF1080 domain-containing protein [Robertkochia marina]